jgi:hypothetical protein
MTETSPFPPTRGAEASRRAAFVPRAGRGHALVGPVADALAAAALARSAMALMQKRRFRGAQCSLHARKGFFAVKRKIPSILAPEGLC